MKSAGLREKAIKIRFFAVSGVALLVVGFLGYHLHIKPILEARELAHALKISHYRGSPKEIMDSFERALSYRTFGDSEAREKLAQIAKSFGEVTNFTKEERRRMTKLAIEELRKEITHPAQDVKYLQYLADVLKNSREDDPQHLKEAEVLLKEAIRISPHKQALYFDLAEIYLYDRKYIEALEISKKAFEINPYYVNASLNLLLAALAIGDRQIAADIESNLKIDLETAYEDTLELLGVIRRGQNDFVAARTIYEKLILRYPRAKYHAVLAAILAELGEWDKAIGHAQIAASRNPDFAREAEIFIKRLEDRREKSKKRRPGPIRSKSGAYR